MEPDSNEVLSEQSEFFGRSKTIRVVELRVGGPDASATIALLKRMVLERVPPSEEVEFVITTEEDRISGGYVKIEGEGVFGYFPRVRKLLTGDGDALVLGAALASRLSLPPIVAPLIFYSPDRVDNSAKYSWRDNVRLQEMRAKERLRSMRKNERNMKRG